MRSNVRNLAIAVVGVTLGASIVFGIPELPRKGQSGVGPLATLALVLVTLGYVRLTRDLVTAQNSALEHSRQAEERRASEHLSALRRQACVETWRICMTDPIYWGGVRQDLIRIKESGDWDLAAWAIKSISEHLKDAETFANELIAHGPNAPRDVERAIIKCAGLAIRAHTISLALESPLQGTQRTTSR